MKILFLDDNRERRMKFAGVNGVKHSITFAKNLDTFMRAWKKDTYDLVFLDHDLAEEHYAGTSDEGSGLTCARYMLDNMPTNKPQVIIHSFNPVGAENIYNLLRDEFNTTRSPGCWTKEIT